MATVEPLLISCVGVEHDLALLPHFLAHYRGLGVVPERMRLILNAPDRSLEALSNALSLLSEHGVEPAEIWTEAYTSDGMWAKRREAQAGEAAPTDRVISADVDELHEYPAPLPEFLAYCDARGVTAVQGPFVDRLSPDGRPACLRRDRSIWEQFPVEAEVAWSVAARGEHHGLAGTLKLMAVKGYVMPSRGGHHPLPGQANVRFLFGAPLTAFAGVANPSSASRRRPWSITSTGPTD